MRSLRSIDQHPYSLSDIQSLRQCVVSKIEFSNRESDNGIVIMNKVSVKNTEQNRNNSSNV